MYKNKNNNSTKKNKFKNKLKYKKRTLRKKLKKGGKIVPKTQEFEFGTSPNNLIILNRIENSINRCNNHVHNIQSLYDDIYDNQFLPLHDRMQAKPSVEIFNQAKEVEAILKNIQIVEKKMINYKIELNGIYNILNSDGEELTPDIRQRYVNEYNDLTIEMNIYIEDFWDKYDR